MTNTTDTTKLTLLEYQSRARTTALYPGAGKPLGLFYCGLKLGGEAGEVSENIGKAIRDDGFGSEKEFLTPERKNKIIKELGDTLWYLANTAYELGFGLDFIAEQNLVKLQDRRERGVLGGSGDDR